MEIIWKPKTNLKTDKPEKWHSHHPLLENRAGAPLRKNYSGGKEKEKNFWKWKSYFSKILTLANFKYWP